MSGYGVVSAQGVVVELVRGSEGESLGRPGVVAYVIDQLDSAPTPQCHR
jgi:hypothetical protein